MADARAAATAATSAAGAAGAAGVPPPVHPELQADQLARLFLSIAGIVVAHNRGKFAHECWQCQYICRETRYVGGVTQPGSLADMVFHGCRLGGVSKLLEEARTCKRKDHEGWRSTTQLMRAAGDQDIEHVRQLLRLGCPTAVVHAQDAEGCTAMLWASLRGYEAVVRELLAHGADVNLKEEARWTPHVCELRWPPRRRAAAVRRARDRPRCAQRIWKARSAGPSSGNTPRSPRSCAGVERPTEHG